MKIVYCLPKALKSCGKLLFVSQKEIDQLLENDVCDKLPFPQFKDACKQFVEADLSTIIKALVNKDDPATVCAQVKACSQKGM